MSFGYRKTASVAAMFALLALLGGPLAAAAPHEVCEAMRHGCDRLEAVTSCCCGDRSESNPSQAASARADAPDCSHTPTFVVSVTVTLAAAPIRSSCPRGFDRPPDLTILLGDLRL